MKPYPFQQKIIDLNRNKLLLSLSCGVGKTLTSLWCMQNLKRTNVIIICPLIVHSKWQSEIALLEPILKTAQPKKNRYHICETARAVYHVVTKEYLTSNIKDFINVEPGGIIYDEAHFIAGMTSKSSKAFNYLVRNYPDASVYLLTATPYLSTPWNIFTLGKHMGTDWQYPSFKRAMFHEVRMGGRFVPVPRSNATDLLQPYLKQISVRITIEEVIHDLPEQKILDHVFELTEEQKQAIQNIDAVEHIVRFTKSHQIENGYIPEEPLAGRQKEKVKENKIDWIREYIQEYPHTAIICRYTEQIAIIEEALGQEVLTLTGQTKNREKVIETARTKQIPIIIQAQVSEGYELPEIEHVIFASMDWSYKNYVQMMGRFLRINAPTPTVFHRLVSGDVDKRVLQSLNNKQDFYVKKDTTKTMEEEKAKAKVQRLRLFKGQ